ncbi:MAG: cell division protein FtsQ/DivIB [Candidatus Omnitrophica bacterium]|nr:cell division protein FtsQ/DivIB [Candidatus Omnitrophota bacterium]
MARKFRKVSLPRFLRIGNLIWFTALVILSLGIFNWTKAFIAHSGYFKIDKVEILIVGRTALTEKTIKELLGIQKGRSIFDVDLKATRDYIISKYPETRGVIVRRVLPNKLVLTVKPRRPVAQISLGAGFYLVDVEGVVLPGPKGLLQTGLPIITGAESRAIVSGLGKKSDYPALKTALNLMQILYQTKFSEEHEIHTIDISDDNNLSLYIEGGIEIKIGGEDFRRRLSMLQKMLETAKLDKNRIKYIDLRFGNVIIGPR